MRDTDKKPIEISEQETRYLNTEVRAADDQKPIIEGMAAVYEQETVIGGMWREIIRKGAFTNVLAKDPDVVCVPNHDLDIVLARTVSKTLSLAHPDDGLKYSAQINTLDQEAMNVYARVKRGDVRQSSFRFTVESDRWTYPPEKSNELPLREILEVGMLYDVSPVTFPGYPTTTAAVRSKSQNQQDQPEGNQAVPPAESPAQDPQVRNDLLRKSLDLIEKS